MGVAGDFVGNLTQRNVQQATRAAPSPGCENRFFPREIELSLFGQIDPYARAAVVSRRPRKIGRGRSRVNLAEAYLELHDAAVRHPDQAGPDAQPVRALNALHVHDLPYIDRPDVLNQFFGEEGLRREAASRLTWVAPLPFYLEVLGRRLQRRQRGRVRPRQLSEPAGHRAGQRTFFELGDSGAIQLGASIATV